jgi:ribosomal protein S18 acetylase RimI-like enzyme
MYFTTIINKLQEAFRLLRSKEFFRIAARICNLILPQSLLSLNKTYIMVHHRDVLLEPNRPCEGVVRRGTLSDIPRLVVSCHETPSSETEDMFRRFFTDGNICYLIENGPRILGYCWVFQHRYIVTFDGYKRSKIQLTIGPQIAFVGNAFIHSDYRTLGFYSQLLQTLTKDLCASDGIVYLLAGIQAENEVSIIAHEKRGFEVLFTIYSLILCGVQMAVIVPHKGWPRLLNTCKGRVFNCDGIVKSRYPGT